MQPIAEPLQKGMEVESASTVQQAAVVFIAATTSTTSPLPQSQQRTVPTLLTGNSNTTAGIESESKKRKRQHISHDANWARTEGESESSQTRYPFLKSFFVIAPLTAFSPTDTECLPRRGPRTKRKRRIRHAYCARLSLSPSSSLLLLPTSPMATFF